MKRHIKLFGATLLSVGWAGGLYAGTAFYNFDQSPATDPLFSGANPAIVGGTHNYINGLGNQQIWCSGNPGTAATGTNGAPKTGGYLSLVDGTNINNNLVVVFPDIDNGLPLSGFQIDMDMRVGNGSLGRPADGFSISFARAGDPVLVNMTNGAVVGGFAGGDGSVAAALNPAGSTDVEIGTKSGVAVCFDAWQGNYLPDTTPYSGVPGTSNDREGIYVRIDDQTKVLLDLINNRNMRDCAVLPGGSYTGNSLAQSNLNNIPGVVGGLSEQTGTNALVTANFLTCTPTYGNTDTSGSFTNLFWEHLMVRLTNVSTTATASNKLTVTWKGVTLIDTNLTTFSATAGRLVLAGRAGGNNQNVHIDNIRMYTAPTTNCTLDFVHGQFQGFTFELADNTGAGASVTNVSQIKLDGSDVTSVVKPNNLTYNPPYTVGVYTQLVRFVSLSSHVVDITFQDNFGNSTTVESTFIVPQYFAFPTSDMVPLASIDTTKQGFLINAYQTPWNNPNAIGWTDELFEGLHGTNMVVAQQPLYNGMQIWNSGLGFANYGGKTGNTAAGNQGLFWSPGGVLINGVATPDSDLTAVGLGGTTGGNGTTYVQDYRHDFYDNVALEIYGYVYFPTSGIYNMCFGNDDQWQLSTASSPYDRLGNVLAASTGVRVPNSSSLPSFGFDVRSVFVDTPGCYPIRMVWENGGGGCIFEWYTYSQPGPNTPGFGTFLINDVANASSANGVVLLGYYDILHDGSYNTGPYVKASQPPRNPPGTSQTYADMYFFSPIVIDLVDGTTYGNTGKAIVTGSVQDYVDGVLVPATVTRSGSNVRLLQNNTPAWSSGIHTNTLTFTDNNGTNYTYSWPFGVIGGAFGGLANLDVTNTTPVMNNNVIAVPASLAQALGSENTSQPGFRVRTWQTPMEAGQSHSGWADEEIQGEKGFNVADLGFATSGYFVWNGLLDLRYDSGGGGSGEWNFDLEETPNATINPNGASLFGVGPNALNPVMSPLMPAGPLDPNYRFVYSGVNTKCETTAIEFSGWARFPTAGYYVISVNSDDGYRIMFPQGSPAGKLNPAVAPYVTNSVMEANVGRGIAGASGGVFNPGSTLWLLNIPQPGVYPLRLLYYNGGTGAGLEVSIVQANADGRVMRMPLNAPSASDGLTYDPATANAVKVYQTLSGAATSSAPYIAHVDPVYDEPDAFHMEPTVVDIADGPAGKTINLANANITLTSDGMSQTVAATQPTPGVTHVVQQFAPGFMWLNGNHTNVLTYQDNLGNKYTNVWWFVARLPNNNIVFVPASQRVDPSQVDHTQPGFRIMGYQSSTGGGGSIQQAEQLMQGVWGPNVLANIPPSGYFTWTNAIDFCDNFGLNGSHGEFRYNYSFSNSLGATLVGGGGNENNIAYIFAGWFEFTKPGLYAMTVNSDDGFKVSTPFGQNPFNEQGMILGWADGGRGDSGGSANPYNGSATPVFFNIPQAGAYPIRLLWYNGGGGLAVEWTMIQPNDDGGYSRMLIGDFASYPNQVKVYQTLSGNPPTVLSSGMNTGATNAPGLVYAAQPQASLNPQGFNAQQTSQLAGYGAGQDFWLTLKDGTIGVNTSTIQLSLNGVLQPITVLSNTMAAGLNNVYRFATNGLWPSGAYGPIIVSFNDMNGTHFSYPVEWVTTPFWGTLHNGFDPSWADTNSPGFRVRTYQVDPAVASDGTKPFISAATTGNFVPPNRNYIYEQVLAGIWGPNWAYLGATNYPSGGPSYPGFIDFGYMDVKGTGPTNGVINFNAAYPAVAGNDFGSNFVGTAGSSTYNQPMPGMRGYGPSSAQSDLRSDAVGLEILTYVLFPTNGTYILGVSSDDGFRLWQQWTPPTNVGAVIINSPAGIARKIPGAINVFEQTASMSCPITNTITGNLVLAQGNYGASTNGEGMALSNGAQISGNIALVYRGLNGVGSVVQQVQNAALAGAKAVVIINRHRTSGALTDGLFAEEFGVTPMQPIPMVCIEEPDGTNIVAALQSGPVNVTLTPDTYALNPPDDRVLGCTSAGKGNTDCNFTVVVTNAPGLYPLRMMYENGNGGVNISWYSLAGVNGTNGNRILINDRSNTNGPALQAFYNLMPPHIVPDGAGHITVSWVGNLYTSTDVTLPLNSWTLVPGPGPITVPVSTPKQFFRAVYAQRP